MSSTANKPSEFLQQAEEIIQAQIANEQFGVSELAEAMAMSRSNLLRRIKKETDLSASQYIRGIRLEKGKELLNETSLTVSEISYQVGFGSASYFVKCFREQYGYPPGEETKQPITEAETESISGLVGSKPRRVIWPYLLLAGILTITGIYLLNGDNSGQDPESQLEKSIAVLPFKNDSNDSSNLYFVNGLMESALSNLQKVEELRVVSRTSVEKYRYSDKDVKEIAAELNVNYLVEGSGQKIGDQILLNIQLIDASADRQLWAEQYNRQLEDIFFIQNEIATRMTEAIKVIVKPEEREQIEKIPTENLEAYDYYLQGLEPYNSHTPEGFNQAIKLFEKAIELDPNFALAYAYLAISYSYLDGFRIDKQYSEVINNYADKALLYDPRSAESLIAKALYYNNVEEYRLALPHLEKALEYNPNSIAVIQLLAGHFMLYDPRASKYLEYSLKGLQIEKNAADPVSTSYLYIHIANAFLQSGFFDEALSYCSKSLALEPNNYFAPYARTLIQYAKDEDLEATKQRLLKEWRKDPSRLDILQEMGKLFYLQKDYDSAAYFYDGFVQGRQKAGIELFPFEDNKIAYVYRQVGREQDAAKLFSDFVAYTEADESIYRELNQGFKSAYEMNQDKAISHLKKFAFQSDYQFWSIMFLELDPQLNSLKSHPEFESVKNQMLENFWNQHQKLEKELKDKRLL